MNDKNNSHKVAKSRAFLAWAILVFAMFEVGCKSVTPLPTVLRDNPSRTDIEQAVNANSAKIQTLSSENATLGLSNTAGWANCRIAYQRPQNVRLVGTANMMGPAVDFGMNGSQCWFWSKFQKPEQISWSPLSQYAASGMKQLIPVDPVWFPDALGVVEINPAEVIEGPVIQPDKTYLIVTQKSRPDGAYRKYTFIEPKTAAVKRQDVLGPDGRMVVSVITHEFQVDPGTQAVLPKKLVITTPEGDGTLELNLGTLRVNPSDMNWAGSFTMPTAEERGVPLVNIAQAGATVPVAAPPTPVYSAPANPAPPLSTPTVAPTPVSPAPSVGAGSGASGFAYPNSTGVEIPGEAAPPTNLASASGLPGDTGRAQAHLQTFITPDENRYVGGQQPYFALPPGL